MAARMLSSYGKLMAAVRAVEKSHAALAQGVATHAEKHEAEMEAKRKRLAQDRVIADAAKRASGKV